MAADANTAGGCAPDAAHAARGVLGYRVGMQSFHALFGRPVEQVGEAPGRVNLIGEHTDYNGGFVLPVAIPQRTRVELAGRPDRHVRVWSAQFPDAGFIEYALGEEARGSSWSDYVKGMTRVLAGYGTLHGFDARIDSTVPVGSGLSSSAALAVAFGRALTARFRLELDELTLARAAQAAEHDLAGAPVGIMDPMACCLATTQSALFIDTRTLDYSHVPIPAACALVVIDSGVAHNHASGDYATRRRECAEAARQLGVAELRDAAADLDRIARLPDPLNRRARHVVTENARVLQMVEALRECDLDRAGDLCRQSHASMRDDFAVSVEPIDTLVHISGDVNGVYGARLTGGGFGGAIVALAEAADASRIGREIIARAQRRGLESARLLVPAGA